ncbi:protein kinase-like domain, Concanavalin A-like lectin/glucanase domain protein [Artemisia annua]|uniref:Protein kinase-like domain, Concanavalin A-like lectin/glucanase domain protein n=1 Tax=Artemisia annua TaxID=35608 RepID=A0A2U1Q5A2_ARTAN|nr:protein kinase-like domain, Concanavalin A-like lectin/glucanase domain protein [Artemisia annua]
MSTHSPSSSNGGNSQSASFVNRQPPSLYGDNSQSDSFVCGQSSSPSCDTSPVMVTTNSTMNVPTTLPSIGTTTSPLNVPPDFVISTQSPVDDQLPIQNDSSMDHDFKLHPLHTMKKLEQYIHSPNEELLAQSVKYHYDDLENSLDLDNTIDQAQKEQMDPKSFKIF